MNILFWLCGLVVGIAVSMIFRHHYSLGTVEVDITDPKCPYLRLRVTDEDLQKLCNRKKVTFKVDNKANFTREKQSL